MQKSDIFIFDEFKNAEMLSCELERLNIFENVFFFKKKKHFNEKHFLALFFSHLCELKYGLYNEKSKLFQSMISRKCIYEINNMHCNTCYKSIFTASWGVGIWKELAFTSRKRVKIYFLDDGIESYNNLDEILNPKAVGIINKIRKFCCSGKYKLDIEGIFLNNCIFHDFKKYKIMNLPDINGKT